MPASKSEKMSAVDTAWLRMDRPANLMMICGVLMLGGRLSIARLRRIVEERFLIFRRFRDCAVETATGSYWRADSRFDIRAHVASIRLAGDAGDRELQALVSKLLATPLARERPMWQFHLVGNFRGGSAVIVRIHHCYADGIALVRVMLSMMDAGAAGPPAMPFESRERRARVTHDDALAQLIAPLTGVLQSARRIGGILIEKGVDIWRDPAQAVTLADQGGALTAEIAKLALMGEDSPTRFKGSPGVAKQVAWADPLPLDDVKTVGHALGASINDLLLACVAGALRGYLIEQGDRVGDVTIRALVPVNLRPLEKAYQLGNRFGLVFLDLPIGIENPIERLYAVRANMSALKGSYQPVLALGLLAAMGAGPKILQETLLTILARNATAVMTNVPGPQRPLWLAGARLDGLMFWVPQSGDIGLGVSILSYDGTVRFGVAADRGLCPDPERVSARFAGEFETLVLATLMSPWPRDGDLDPALAARAVGAA
ncbi:MAG TPA: wax ester/triacylglycerol synthase family O-acyltransferase [Casimicrobiaceae bacterium]